MLTMSLQRIYLCGCGDAVEEWNGWVLSCAEFDGSLLTGAIERVAWGDVWNCRRWDLSGRSALEVDNAGGFTCQTKGLHDNRNGRKRRIRWCVARARLHPSMHLVRQPNFPLSSQHAVCQHQPFTPTRCTLHASRQKKKKQNKKNGITTTASRTCKGRQRAHPLPLLLRMVSQVCLHTSKGVNPN